MIRFFDILFSAIGLILTLPIVLLLCVIGCFDTGSPLFIQERVGRYKKGFKLVKFRTMKIGTASAASHLVGVSPITRYGAFLRKTKLDELPQLFNVLRGEMSLVGPRPGLFNQDDLLEERSSQKVYSVRPGITGLAQINGVDMSAPKELAALDAQMIQSMTALLYFKIIIATLLGKGSGDAAEAN